MEIIKNEERTVEVYYYLEFQINDKNGGFTFPCDKDGHVNIEDLADSGRANYQKCIDGKFGPGTVERYEYLYTNPSVGLCICGREVELGNFTNTCDCGRDNWAGQQLAPRHLWGEETGETF